MKSIILAKGSGYADDRTFEPYEIIREPLPKREDRIFHGQRWSVDYGSHWLALAKEREGGPGWFILMRHGGGSRVIRIPLIYSDGGAMKAAWLAMDDRTLYATLYAFQDAVTSAADAAQIDEGREWRQAFVDKRIRKSRVKQGRCRVWIDSNPVPA